MGILLLIINVAILFSKDNWSLRSHEKNIVLSYNRLATLADTSKIVVISGSNGGFSINSRMISEAFHKPVVNTSTHAGIGVRMQFEIYKDFLRQGDIVIFCPEYGGGKGRLYGGSALIRILSTHIPSTYKKMSFPQLLFILKYIGVHHKEVKSHSGVIKPFEGPYSAKAVNSYGDIECKRLHSDNIVSYSLSDNLDYVIDYYKYVHTYARERGIKIVFLPPTFMEREFMRNNRQIDSFSVRLKREGIPYQALPSRYSFPDSLYYDTPYHMTQLGANKRTEVIIEDLRRLLGED